MSIVYILFNNLLYTRMAPFNQKMKSQHTCAVSVATSNIRSVVFFVLSKKSHIEYLNGFLELYNARQH